MMSVLDASNEDKHPNSAPETSDPSVSIRQTVCIESVDGLLRTMDTNANVVLLIDLVGA